MNLSTRVSLILPAWYKNSARKVHSLSLSIIASLPSLGSLGHSYLITPLVKIFHFICNAILPPGGNKQVVIIVIFP